MPHRDSRKRKEFEEILLIIKTPTNYALDPSSLESNELAREVHVFSCINSYLIYE